ncbi:MAG: hypothetical protein AAF639_40920 [Chloroflexota bacterium]
MLLSHLEMLIEYQFQRAFTENIELLPDPIGCLLMNLCAIPHETGYQLDPDIPYRRGEMPCHIVEFLSEHRAEL